MPQGVDAHEVRQEGVGEDRRDDEPRDGAQRPPSERQGTRAAFASARESRDPTLDRAVDELEVDRLGTGVPAPHPAEDRREQEYDEEQRDDEYPDQRSVLGEEGRPEQGEPTVDDV